MSTYAIAPARSGIWLLHVAVEAPAAAVALFFPQLVAPYVLGLTNTSLVLLKIWAIQTLALSLGALLVSSLPDTLPGKRALALVLLSYHAGVSFVLTGAPRIVPYSLGGTAERLGLSIERLGGAGHALLALGVALWWQLTIGSTKAVGAQARKAQ